MSQRSPSFLPEMTHGFEQAAGAPTSPVTPYPPFVAALQKVGERYARAVFAHPFLASLADGTLSQSHFAFYLVQDYHFLQAAAKAFSLVVARVSDDDWLMAFNRCATEVLVLERSLHAHYFEVMKLESPAVVAAPMAPTNEAYSSYLLALAQWGTFPEALSALLPCFWLYRDLGRSLLRSQTLQPRYRPWAEFYGGTAYDAMVDALLELVEDVGSQASAEGQQRMLACFQHACRYEWMFWEMNQRQETWPEPTP